MYSSCCSSPVLLYVVLHLLLHHCKQILSFTFGCPPANPSPCIHEPLWYQYKHRNRQWGIPGRLLMACAISDAHWWFRTLHQLSRPFRFRVETQKWAWGHHQNWPTSILFDDWPVHWPSCRSYGHCIGEVLESRRHPLHQNLLKTSQTFDSEYWGNASRVCTMFLQKE